MYSIADNFTTRCFFFCLHNTRGESTSKFIILFIETNFILLYDKTMFLHFRRSLRPYLFIYFLSLFHNTSMCNRTSARSCSHNICRDNSRTRHRLLVIIRLHAVANRPDGQNTKQ